MPRILRHARPTSGPIHSRISPVEAQRQHFEEAAHQYPPRLLLDPPLHTRLEQEQLLRALDGLPRGTRVIDFGAGTGRLTFALARAGFEVLAVDVSATSLKVLSGVAAAHHIDTIQTALELPITGTVGAIVGADVLHHVDLDAVLPQLRALLVPGGRLVFSEPGGGNPSWYGWALLAGRLRIERGIAACTRRSLTRALDRHGFNNVRITGVGLLPRPLAAWSTRACEIHDRAGNLPLLRSVAYRYLIEAEACA